MRPHSLAAIAAITALLTMGLSTTASATHAASGPITIGNRTYFDDGTVEVEFPPDTYSLSECDTGQFCVWSQANYAGSFRYKTGTGVKAVGGTVGSFWNNRTTIAYLYTNTSSASTCYEDGAMRSSVSASYSSAEQVNLSTSSSC